MRLPHELVRGPLFLFESAPQLVQALGPRATAAQVGQIEALVERGLPPVVSQEALAVMIGVNSGLIWSFLHRPHRHYRVFEIPKGRDVRKITAPKIALKVIQKWLSIHLTNSYTAPDHVYGFIPNRSHVDAAMVHVGAKWSYSADIRDFFGTTPELAIVDALRYVGYDDNSSRLVAKLCCFGRTLAQGAPTSPILSNICFRTMDDSLVQLAGKFGCKVTRYADDIVFSGDGEFNAELQAELHERLALTPWRIAEEKELRQPLKGRIKLHGLLIGENSVRLTKGYRNQMRALAHIQATKNLEPDQARKLAGHIAYARHVQAKSGSPSGISKRSEERLNEQAKARQPDRDRSNLFGFVKRLIGMKATPPPS